jgi:hypothetical protein
MRDLRHGYNSLVPNGRAAKFGDNSARRKPRLLIVRNRKRRSDCMRYFTFKYWHFFSTTLYSILHLDGPGKGDPKMPTICDAFQHAVRTVIAFVLGALGEPDARQPAPIVVRSDHDGPNMRNRYGRTSGGANGL